MDAAVLVLSILAGAFWPVALVGVVLDAMLWTRPGWIRTRRPFWLSALGLALVGVVVTVGALVKQVLDGFYMALTWTPIAGIVLAWAVIGSWRRATHPLPDPADVAAGREGGAGPTRSASR